MRSALVLVAVATLFAALGAACDGVSTPGNATPTGSATPTPGGSPTPSGTATPPVGNGPAVVQIQAQCSATVCNSTGNLYGVVVDCNNGTVLLSGSSMGVTLVDGTPSNVDVLHVTPGGACITAFLDLNGNAVLEPADPSPLFAPVFISVAATGTTQQLIFLQ